jgi:hypothetical protein
MTEREIALDIREVYGASFINKSQAAKYMAKSVKRPNDYLKGLDCFEDGKMHKYFYKDIAKAIMANVAKAYKQNLIS